MANQQIDRAALDELLERTNISLKWSWQIVMGFALVKAVEELYKLVFDLASVPLVHSLSDQILCFLLFFFGFIPAFIRFFYGDTRYLDLHYLGFRRVTDSTCYGWELKKLSIARRAVDILLLLTHGIIFIFMSKSIGNPNGFFAIYGVLMITNSAWLKTTVEGSGSM